VSHHHKATAVRGQGTQDFWTMREHLQQEPARFEHRIVGDVGGPEHRESAGIKILLVERRQLQEFAHGIGHGRDCGNRFGVGGRLGSRTADQAEQKDQDMNQWARPRLGVRQPSTAFVRGSTVESGIGLPHSKTIRQSEWFMERVSDNPFSGFPFLCWACAH